MFVFGLFTVVLLLSGTARGDGKNGEATAATAKADVSEATARKTTEAPSTVHLKGGRRLRLPPPRNISGKSYAWSTHEIFPGRSYNEHPSTQHQLKQLPHQTIYYHGPVGKSKSQIQRYREFAMKNNHHVKNAGVYGPYGQGSQPSSQQSQGFENQLNGGEKAGFFGQESDYDSKGESNGDGMGTSNPIEQFVAGQTTNEYSQRPLGERIEWGYQQGGPQSQTGYTSQVFGSSQTNSYPQRGGGQAQTGFPSPGSSQIQTGLLGRPEGVQSENRHPVRELGNGQTQSGYPQRPGTGQKVNSQYPSGSQTLFELQGGSQSADPNQGTSQSQGGYPQRPISEQTQSGFVQSQSSSMSQINNSQRPGSGQYQMVYPQQGVSNGQSGYPSTPLTGIAHQQGGNLIKGGYGSAQTGSSQNQLGSKQNQKGSTQQQGEIQSQASGYPQKPIGGQGSIGYPQQQQAGGQNQGLHNYRPGSNQQGFIQRPDNVQTQSESTQNGGNQNQTGYPQNPTVPQGSNQYQGGAPQQPVKGQNQSGSFQQQAGNQKQSGQSGPGWTKYPHQQGTSPSSYPQGSGIGQYGSTQQNLGVSQIGGGYPQKPVGGQMPAGSSQQYLERPSSGLGEYGSQQQVGNQLQGGYPQRPGSGQSGPSQLAGGSQLYGKYPEKPIGVSHQQQGGSHALNGQIYRPGSVSSSQRPISGQQGFQYPHRPVSGQYGSTPQPISNQMQGSGYPQRPIVIQQRPGSGQGQYGPQQHGGNQMQVGYPSQKPGIGMYQGNEGDGNEFGMHGNGMAEFGGSSHGTGESGLTTNDRLRQYCKAPRGQFASESCNKFVNCWDDVVVEQECGGVLVFNEEKSYCDYPENVNCGGRVTSSPSMGMEGGSSCPSSFATYRSNYDCGEFIVCAHGIAHRFHCAGGLAYNDTLGVCDYPRNVDCMGIPLLPYPDEESPSEMEEGTNEIGNASEGSSYGATTESADSGLWNYRQSKKNKKLAREEEREK